MKCLKKNLLILIIITLIFVYVSYILIKENNETYYSEQNLVSVYLNGGLANQMFQVAMGYCLAKKQGNLFVVLNRSFNPHSSADYFQTIFRKVKYQPELSPKFKEKYVENAEDAMKYVDLSPYKNKDTVYHGYFQSERYLDREMVLDLFQIEPERERRLVSKFPDLDCYFIHIRRGDYLTSGMHNVDLTMYYQRALNYILAFDKSAKFMVFSNDIPYCMGMDVLKKLGNRIRYMDDDSLDELDSLYLMSMCRRGGIAANSSFSWWAGYLNTNPKKMVTYPQKWLNNDWIKEIGWRGCVVIEV